MSRRRSISRQNIGTRLITQLTALFMLIFAVLILMTSFITYDQVRKVMERQSADLTQRNMRQTEQSFLSYADELNRELLLLTGISEVEGYLDRGWADDVDVILRARSIFEEVSRLMRYFPEIESVFYYAENGTVIGQTATENLVFQERDFSQSFYGSELQTAVMETPWESLWFGTYSSGFFLDNEEAGQPYFTVARSINRNGRHFAAVVMNIDAAKVQNYFTGSSDDDTTYYLVNENGKVIAATDKTLVGSDMDLTMAAESLGRSGYASEIAGKDQMNYHRIGNTEGLRWTWISRIPLRTLYRVLSALRKWFIGSVLAVMLLGFLAARYFLYRITKPLDELRLAMGSLEEGNLGEQLPQKNKSELGRLGEQFNAMSTSIDRLVTQTREMEQEKRTLEQDALQAQITPHFLFNTLTNVKYMAIAAGAGNIAECITALGNFLRPIYQNSGREWTIPEEFAYLENYICIMNYRFGGKIHMELRCEESVRQDHFPQFILQPVLENAISHGFEEREGEGRIDLLIRSCEDHRRVIVKDDGRA